MHQLSSLTSNLKKSGKLALPLFLSASLLTTTACGTQGFGVGRNPLGRGERPGAGSLLPGAANVFDGNPEQLSALFLRSRSKAHLAPGQNLALEVIAVDRNGKLIDPSKLKLVFTSSEMKNVTVDPNGVLTGLIPFEDSQIKVVDEKTGVSTTVDVTVGPKEFTGNPEALNSLELVLRQQTVPGSNEEAQYLVIAKDILGNPIDPARLRLEWSVSDPSAFKIDKNGLVTALLPNSEARVLVRDAVTGRMVSGTVRSLGVGTPATTPGTNPGTKPGTNSGTNPNQPGPNGPSSNGPGTTPVQQPNDGNPNELVRILLTPASISLHQGEKGQYSVTLIDKSGKHVDPATVNLQWFSGAPDKFDVDDKGVVTSKTPDRTNAMITVSVPGKNLSATAEVRNLPRQSSGGGGGGGGGGAVAPAPGTPGIYTSPFAVDSFHVHIVPPTTGGPVDHYRLTISGLDGPPQTFDVPPSGSGEFVFDIPVATGLDPDTSYPVTLVAVGGNSRESAAVDSIGTTLKVNAGSNAPPTNLFAGTQDFSGIIPMTVNTPRALNRASGTGLQVGDPNDPEVLTTEFNFLGNDSAGTLSISGSPANVTVTGTGTAASPLRISGPKDDVSRALDGFVYTPANNFQGTVSVRMLSSDDESLSDTDILTFSVNNATPAPPVNAIDANSDFADFNTNSPQLTGRNTDLIFNTANGNAFSVSDANGDTLTVLLTPSNGAVTNLAGQAGVTVSQEGNNLRLVGHPLAINSLLAGGIRFTPSTDYAGAASINITTSAPDGSDSDTVTINVLEPGNLFRGNRSFGTEVVGTERGFQVTLEGDDELQVTYPPGSNVRVTLTLTDGNGANPDSASNGGLSFVDDMGLSTTSGTASITIEGDVSDVNAALAAGVMYTPPVNSSGTFRILMQSVDTANAGLNDNLGNTSPNADFVYLKVSVRPINRYNNNPNAFPPVNNAIQLVHNSSLTFEPFRTNALSVQDDDTDITVIFTPSTGEINRSSAPPNGVTQSGAGNPNDPLVFSGPRATINAMFNTGVTFRPPTGFQGPATVTMTSRDPSNLEDTDIVHINVLGPPENRLSTDAGTSADFASFSDNPLLGRPAVALALDGTTAYNTPNEPLTFEPDVRRLSIANYADGTDIDVELRVPSGSLTIGNANGTTVTGNGTGAVNLSGTQANINLALATLSFSPGAIAAPTTVPLTIYSTSGTAEDGRDGVDLANFLITAAPVNEYRSQGPASNPTAAFPSGGSALRIYNTVPLNFDGSQELSGSFVLSPDPLLRVNDDSMRVIVTLSPANNTILSLTGPPPGNVITSGGMTANTPLVIEGSPADVNTTLAMLRFNNNGYLGATTIQMSTSDGAATPVSNTIELNVVPLPQNSHNGGTTFTTDVLPIRAGSAQSLPGGNLNLSGTSSYPTGETVTVRLEIPDGAGTLSVTGDTNADPDIVEISGTVDGSGNVPTITSALAGLTLNLIASPNNPITLTMTSGPLADSDSLQLRPSDAIVNNYNASTTFDPTAVLVNEGTPVSFNGNTTANPTLSVVDDSPSVRVTLTPGLVGGNNAGTLSVTNQGVSVSGLGTNASPLVLEGTPANVNATLATLSFSSAAGINGTTTITMLSNDFSSTDTDTVNLDLRARPSNVFTLNGSSGVTFPGTGAPRTVGLNTSYALDGFDSGTASLDRPRLSVNFYGVGDTVTVTLTQSAANGSLSAPAPSGGSVSGNGQPGTPLVLTGSQANVNTALGSLVYTSSNTSGNVDIEMISSNGTVGDNTPNQDVIRLAVQNSPPVNSLTGTNSGFVNTSGNTPLPLRMVSDSTTVEDNLDFGQTDPTSPNATGFTVTANTWPTLSVADDETLITTRVTPPVFGTLSDRIGGTPFAGTGASVSSSGGAIDFTGTPAQVNAALLRLRFTPNANVVSGTSGNLTIQTTDGGGQSDTDTMAILVERPTLPLTFGGNPNPSGPVFRAVYQFGRDRLPQIVVNDIAVSGPEIQAGAQIEIVRYNENDPLTLADDDTDVLRTITLNSPATNETVTFNNQTNRATVTVDFPAGTPLPVPGTLNDGVGKIGARLSGGNIDTPSEPDFRGTATHPFDFFVYPERAQYAVEDYFSGANNRGRWYLINTSSSLGSGLGRLTMVYDSNGTQNIQNGLNATTDVTAGLAKNPINGEVYYVDQQGTSPNFSGRLIRWIPSRGIQDDRGGSGSATDPFSARGNLTVTNGLGLTYTFGDKPARLSFNSTVNGAVKTATLYAGAAYNTVDGAGSLSGFYRIRNFESGTLAVDHIRLLLSGEDFGLNTSYLNNGDFVFEPDTDSTATANNRMFLTNNNKLYVTTAPVPDTGTADVNISEISLAGISAALQLSGDPATQIVGLSIDGEWTAGSRSLLMITRYSGAGNTTKSRLYRVTYDSSYAITGATLLGNGDFQMPEYSGPIPLVDITAAHQP